MKQKQLDKIAAGLVEPADPDEVFSAVPEFVYRRPPPYPVKKVTYGPRRQKYRMFQRAFQRKVFVRPGCYVCKVLSCMPDEGQGYVTCGNCGERLPRAWE